MSLTIQELVLYVGILAMIFTAITWFTSRERIKNVFVSFLQNFTGAIFIVSGWVKAVDPMGTAFKMEQYFAEFETVSRGSWLSFMADIFPFFSEYSIIFALVMIIAEIVLGIMLIIGAFPKLSAWLFFLTIVLFTILTGFTYLTGHVPQADAAGNAINFFEFAKWGPWVESNMRVTDCGCFGDFIKMKPITSFSKDIFLLVPAIIFLFTTKKFHQFFTPLLRNVITVASLIGITYFCMSNYAWDIPDTDFRPFRVGVNIPAQRALEEEAEANIPVDYKMTNKASKKIVQIPMEQFLLEYKKYPKEEWDFEQIHGIATIPSTKISEFAVEAEKLIETEYLIFVDEEGDSLEISTLDTIDGNPGEGWTMVGSRKESHTQRTEITDELLTDPNYSFMIVCYKYKYDYSLEDVVIDGKTIEKENLLWKRPYQEAFAYKINPLAIDAEKNGNKIYGVVGGATDEMVEDFRHSTQTPFPFYTADDILLKTIVRSNPGVVLLKNGTIIKKWHYKQLPSFDVIKAEYMK